MRHPGMRTTLITNDSVSVSEIYMVSRTVFLRRNTSNRHVEDEVAAPIGLISLCDDKDLSWRIFNVLPPGRCGGGWKGLFRIFELVNCRKLQSVFTELHLRRDVMTMIHSTSDLIYGGGKYTGIYVNMFPAR